MRPAARHALAAAMAGERAERRKGILGLVACVALVVWFVATHQDGIGRIYNDFAGSREASSPREVNDLGHRGDRYYYGK